LRVENVELRIKVIFFFLFLILTGCGYKPSIKYQDNLLSEKIKVENKIDIKNPRETIFLKDAINDAVFTILNKNLCYENCDTILKIHSANYYLSVLDYDKNGFPSLYRANVSLNVTLIDKNKKSYNYEVSGIYDFRVESNSIINDETKLNAYKQATINALNKLFALIAKDGAEK